MKLPVSIEREIRAIEDEYAQRGGQLAGPPRLRGLRAAIEQDRQRHAEAVEAAYKEGHHRADDKLSDLENCGVLGDEECDAAWDVSQAKARLYVCLLFLHRHPAR